MDDPVMMKSRLDVVAISGMFFFLLK